MPRVKTRINIHDTVPKDRSVVVEDSSTGDIQSVTTDYGFVTIEAEYDREDAFPFTIKSISFSVV